MAERASRSTRIRALLSLGTAAAVGVTGTYAYWTDTVQVTGTALTTGTIDLKVNGQDAVTGWTSLNLAAMMPGNSTAGVLTVSNSGTAPLQYYLGSSATNADGKGLAAALTLTVTGAAAVTGTSPTATCGGAALTGSATTLATEILGSPASPRTLAAGASETICLQLTLPGAANTSLQGATTSVTFTASGTSY